MNTTTVRFHVTVEGDTPSALKGRRHVSIHYVRGKLAELEGLNFGIGKRKAVSAFCF
jgi:hypothetical protein